MPDSNPFEVGLGKLIALDRKDDFIGKPALIYRSKQGPTRRLVGVTFDGTPVRLNEHPWPAKVEGQLAGTVRAVCHSPRRGENVGLALLDTQYVALGTELEIDGEAGAYRGEVVSLPLVPPGKTLQKVD